MKISIKNVSKIYKKTSVLDDINYIFTEGKIYAIKGENGSGKTLLLKTVSGLLKPDKGEVFIDKKQLYKNIDFCDKLGALIETPDFIPNISGYKNLKCISLLKRSASDDDIKKAMLALELDPDSKLHVSKYSLGMKQKLGIASVIMESPEIIILDEPANALDSEALKKLTEILCDLKKENKLIIISYHNCEELDSIADVTLEIKSGRINYEE